MPRLLTEQGGPRVRMQLLPDPPPRGLSRELRGACTTLRRQLQNDRLSYFRLELLLYANFSPADLVVELTYDAEHAPPGWRQAKPNVPRFLRRVREARRAQGQEARYVYVHEALHGDKRPHHHLVINRGRDGPGPREPSREDVAALAALWGMGYVHVDTIAGFGGYQKLAKYITKEPRDKGRPRPGERTWTPSMGLVQPLRRVEDVPAGFVLEPPPGAQPVADGLDIIQKVAVWYGGELPRLDAILGKIMT